MTWIYTPTKVRVFLLVEEKRFCPAILTLSPLNLNLVLRILKSDQVSYVFFIVCVLTFDPSGCSDSERGGS